MDSVILKLRKFIKAIVTSIFFDLLMLPLVIFSAFVMLVVRKVGFSNLVLCRKISLNIGIIPIRRHFYEPFVSKHNITYDLSIDRLLPGISLNIEEQLLLLKSLTYSSEISHITDDFTNHKTFHFKNGCYEAGDAEYWYNLIRLKKPSKIIEIGSGHSTKIAQLAIKKNTEENKLYSCHHICIEPYLMPWLEELDVTIIREKVENVDKQLFKQLSVDDILFIDSSHILRPQGDVVYEYLELLPDLSKGVIVHIHDIFTPKDYLSKWILEDVLLWNEQYMLEAFMTNNSKWKVIGAINFLHHNYFKELKHVCPFLVNDGEPGSFYITKTG